MACDAQEKIIGTTHGPHFSRSHGKSSSSESTEDLAQEIYRLVHSKDKRRG
jgi:hypothetical protein